MILAGLTNNTVEWMTSSKKTSKIVTDICLHANQNLLNMYANYSSFRKFFDTNEKVEQNKIKETMASI